MAVSRALTAAVVSTTVALGSAIPARATDPPPDGTYTYLQAGVPSPTWRVSAVCDQVSRRRAITDFSDPVITAEQCLLHVVSSTPSDVKPEDKLQNYTGTARLTNDLWTFQVRKDAGVLCPDGSTAPSTETYAFDDVSLTGTHTTIHADVCGMQPAMSKEPFTLQFQAPLSPPVERYPLICDNIARCY